MQNINIAFQLSTIYLNPSQLLLSKSILKSTVYTKKYGQIKASIKEIGIIEPLIVAPTAEVTWLAAFVIPVTFSISYGNWLSFNPEAITLPE